MLGNNFNNQSIKVKVLGINTANDGEISGGLAALNCMLEKNLLGVNYLAIDRHDICNLATCKTTHKFRLLEMADEQNLIRNLCGTYLIFIVADKVWENIKTVAIAAHCAKKFGAPVILIAGGNFQDAEDEIIFDAVIKLPSEGFATAATEMVENFIEVVTLSGYPKLDFKTLADFMKDSAAIISYGEAANSVVLAAKRAFEHVENFELTKKILFNVTASKGNFSLEEAKKLSNLLKNYAPEAEVLFGFSVDDWLVKKIKFLLLTAR